MQTLIRLLDQQAPPEDEGASLLEDADDIGSDCD